MRPARQGGPHREADSREQRAHEVAAQRIPFRRHRLTLHTLLRTDWAINRECI
jgi:hypothetical protein